MPHYRLSKYLRRLRRAMPPPGAPASALMQYAKLPASAPPPPDPEVDAICETHPLLAAPPARIDIAAVAVAASPPTHPACACGFGSFKLGVLTVFVFAAAYGLSHFNADTLQQLFAALQNDPMRYVLAFWILYIAAVVFMLPGMVLAVGAGATYGFYVGSAIIWTATSIGQTLAFLLGRYLFRDAVASWLLQRVERFSSIEEAVAREGWKLVFLLRISPLVPYNVLNYLLAVTPVSLSSFALPSAVAIIPWTAGFAYIGSVSSNVVDVIKGSTSRHVSLGWMIVSLLGMVVVACTVAAIARRALASVMEEKSNSKRADALATAPLPSPPNGGSGTAGATIVIEMASEAYGVKS